MQIKFTPIIPKPINVEAMRQKLIDAMRDVGEEIRENFEDITKTWHDKPTFSPATSVPKVGIDFITVETTTEDKVYGWLNEGTKKHWIAPVNAKRLHFKSEFIAKTIPGIVGSGVGFIGGDDKFSYGLMHPGNEARKWDKEIAERQKNNFKISLERALGYATKASGHKL